MSIGAHRRHNTKFLGNFVPSRAKKRVMKPKKTEETHVFQWRFIEEPTLMDALKNTENEEDDSF